MPKLRATAGVDIDDGTYEATLLDVIICDPTENSPNKNQWLKWLFQVYDGSDDGLEMSGTSSLSFSPKSKARGWVEALLARKMAVDEEVDTDTLCPKECQVTVKKDLDSGFTKIIDVMAPRRRQAPQRPQASARPRQQPAPAAAGHVDGVEVGDDDPQDDIPF